MKKNCIIFAIILIIGAVLVAGCTSNNKQTPTTTPTPEVIYITGLVTPTTQDMITTSPVVEIISQECEPNNQKFPEVTTVLKNNGDITVTSDLILKVYSEANVLLGTFKQTVTIPPHENNSTKIVMYGVNYFQTSSMSSEFPGLEQISPPRKNSGYQCPGFRKAQL